MISSRYGIAFIALAGIALVPTLIHTYAGLTHNDGLITSRISRSLAGLRSEPTSRTAKWVNKIFQSDDWIERRYQKPGVDPLLLFVGRSYDPKRLYHHPELALVHGIDLEKLGTVRVTQMPDAPIHLLRSTQRGKNNLVLYALFHEGHFVENPYFFQLKNAWRSLFRPRKPMTLFFVYDPVSSPHLSIGESRALRLLNEAIENFLSQKPKIKT